MSFMFVEDHLIPILDEMLMDLSTNRLEVCLIPSKYPDCARDGGMIRAVTSQNPAWYQALCAMYPCTRTKQRRRSKDDTKIKRQNIFIVLENMIKNKKAKSIYAKDLLKFAKSSYEFSNREIGKFAPWNNQF